MPKALIFYHYFHPDDVISAEHKTGLALGLIERGWDVTAMPCNRGCRDESQTWPAREIWRKIDIRRIWRPNLRQASFIGRLCNAAWMIAAWSLQALRSKNAPDVLIVGTDPIFSVLTVLCWRLFRPRVKIVHWCFDLHPEAALADGQFSERNPAVRLLKFFLRKAYARCDLIFDLGPCMRQRLQRYGSSARFQTATPWALFEPPQPLPPDPVERTELFGPAKLGLMYSGNFGVLHAHERTLELARRLRDADIRFVFSIRGNRADAVRKAVTAADTNISFAGFAPQERLNARLGAPDIHLVSLKDDWAGTAVPSKFFGCLAAGRPVLYDGPADSAIGVWIAQYNIGWLLRPETLACTEQQLRELSQSPESLREIGQRCFATYQQHFSYRHMIELWDRELRQLLGEG